MKISGSDHARIVLVRSSHFSIKSKNIKNKKKRKKKSEDAKRSIQGALVMKPQSFDDRKPSSEAVAATPPTGKRVIIKIADVLPEMQKEAVDTTISVGLSFSLSISLYIKKKKKNSWVCDFYLVFISGFVFYFILLVNKLIHCLW